MKHLLLNVLCYLFVFSSLAAQNPESLLDQGDQFAEKQFDNYKALEKYLAADKISPNNWEVQWRLSRTYVDIAEMMPSATDQQKQEQLNKYQTSLEYAEKAVKLAPQKSVNYLARAIVNGRIALYKGVFTALGLVKEVKNDAEKVIKLNNGSNYVQAVSHYILGRTHFKVCEKSYLVRLPLGLGWGDMEIAEKELKKAIELYPNFRMFHLELGKVYIENEEYDKAKECLSKVRSLNKLNQSDDKYLSEASKLLNEIKNK